MKSETYPPLFNSPTTGHWLKAMDSRFEVLWLHLGDLVRRSSDRYWTRIRCSSTTMNHFLTLASSKWGTVHWPRKPFHALRNFCSATTLKWMNISCSGERILSCSRKQSNSERFATTFPQYVNDRTSWNHIVNSSQCRAWRWCDCDWPLLGNCLQSEYWILLIILIRTHFVSIQHKRANSFARQRSQGNAAVTKASSVVSRRKRLWPCSYSMSGFGFGLRGSSGSH